MGDIEKIIKKTIIEEFIKNKFKEIAQQYQINNSDLISVENDESDNESNDCKNCFLHMFMKTENKESCAICGFIKPVSDNESDDKSDDKSNTESDETDDMFIENEKCKFVNVDLTGRYDYNIFRKFTNTIVNGIVANKELKKHIHWVVIDTSNDLYESVFNSLCECCNSQSAFIHEQSLNHINFRYEPFKKFNGITEKYENEIIISYNYKRDCAKQKTECDYKILRAIINGEFTRNRKKHEFKCHDVIVFTPLKEPNYKKIKQFDLNKEDFIIHKLKVTKGYNIEFN